MTLIITLTLTLTLTPTLTLTLTLTQAERKKLALTHKKADQAINAASRAVNMPAPVA